MFGLGQWELLIVFLVVLLLFGARRIPEMAQGLGKGIKEFRKAVRDVQGEVDVSPKNADTGPSIGGTVATQPPAPAAAPPSTAAPPAPATSDSTSDETPKG